MEKSKKSLRIKGKRKKDEGGSSHDSMEYLPTSKKAKTSSFADMSNSHPTSASVRATAKATPKTTPKVTPKSTSSQSRSSSSEYPRVMSTPKATPSTTPSSATPPKSKLLTSKRAKGREKRKVDREKTDSEEEVLPGRQTAAVNSTASSTTDVSVKVKRRRRKSLKQTCGSAQAHAGSVLMYRCIQSALKQGADYRNSLDSTDWASVSSEVSLTHKDLSLIWLLITREYGDMSLEDILTELKPAATVSAHHLSWKDIMDKLKSEKPKAPLTAYMLYCQTMRAKFKEKYPDLTHGQLAIKIGKKWKSLPITKQMKYREIYQKSYVEYRVKMEKFLAKHPEAMSSRMKSRSISSMEANKVMKLKELKPKCPPSAMTLYIKAKTAAVLKKHPGFSQRDVKEKLNRQWKSLSLLDMAPYRKQHIESNAKYEEDLVKFFTDNPGAEQLLASTRKSKKRLAEELSESTAGMASGAGRKGRRQEDSSSESLSSDEEEEEEEDEEVLSGPSHLPSGQDGPSPSSTLTTPANVCNSKQEKSYSTPSLTKPPKWEGPSSSTPCPPKHPNDSVHIPIVDSDDLSSSDSSEY